MPLLLLHHLQTSRDPSALLLAARLRWMRHLLAHHAEHGVLAHTWYGAACCKSMNVGLPAWWQQQHGCRTQHVNSPMRASLTRDGPARCLLLQMLLLLSSWPVGQVLLQI